MEKLIKKLLAKFGFYHIKDLYYTHERDKYALRGEYFIFIRSNYAERPLATFILNDEGKFNSLDINGLLVFEKNRL